MLITMSRKGTSSTKVAGALDSFLAPHAGAASATNGPIAKNREHIDACFSASSLPEVFANLEAYDKDPTWAAKTLATLRKKSPTSVRVVFELLRSSDGLSVDEALEREFRVAMRLAPPPPPSHLV